jgi:hypothetical protein
MLPHKRYRSRLRRQYPLKEVVNMEKCWLKGIEDALMAARRSGRARREVIDAWARQVEVLRAAHARDQEEGRC